MSIGWDVALIFQESPAGVSTYPTLRGLPRVHRAVLSLALDELCCLCSISNLAGDVKCYAATGCIWKRPRTWMFGATGYENWQNAPCG